LALIASLGAALVFFALAPWFSAGLLLRLIVTALGFANVLYLLGRSSRKIGRLSAFTLWVLLATLGFLCIDSLLGLIALHLGMIWLIRCVYFHASAGAALLDFGLCALSLAAALRVFSHTGSLALAIWCLFLIQALVAMIPADFKPSRPASASLSTEADRFDRAWRSAERALRKLS
ncbi:MAG: hypothetical protein ACRERS_03370, partial [Methylococcales bacterium]